MQSETQAGRPVGPVQPPVGLARPDVDRMALMSVVAWLRGEERGGLPQVNRGDAALAIETLLVVTRSEITDLAERLNVKGRDLHMAECKIDLMRHALAELVACEDDRQANWESRIEAAFKMARWIVGDEQSGISGALPLEPNADVKPTAASRGSA